MSVGGIGFFRDRLLRARVEGGALFCEDSAFDFEVVAKCIADEIEGVVVPRFEVHRVYLVAARAVDNAADAGPETGHGAHAAWLQCAVERAALERIGLELGAKPADDDHFRVRCWIVPHLALIEACGRGCAIFDQYCADFCATGCLLAFACLLNREAHETEILLSGHANWMLSRWSI
jgi:hypothetical protein